ncbi:MAG: acyltransferase [Pyrinomonadaceae bacterium]
MSRSGVLLTSASPNRIPSLDGLRTISILLVIASHAAFRFGHQGIFNIGDLGVRVFFVISGFLITGLLVHEYNSTDRINLVKFYFRRTLRIFPPYYFFLIILASLTILGKMKNTFSQFWPVFAYVSDYIHPGEWNFDHTWSLSVEEQFYLIYPGILVFLGRRKIELLLVATILLCPLVRAVDHRLFIQYHPIWLIKGFHANVDTLGMGCLLALKQNWLYAKPWYNRLLSSKAMCLLPWLIVAINTQIDYAGLNLGILFSLNNVLIALFIHWAVTRSNNHFGRLLNSRPFVFVGMMSYSIYIWQQPFLNPVPQSKYFAFPFNLAGFLFFVCFSYFVVERTSLRIRKKYESELFAVPEPKPMIPDLLEV